MWTKENYKIHKIEAKAILRPKLKLRPMLEYNFGRRRQQKEAKVGATGIKDRDEKKEEKRGFLEK